MWSVLILAAALVAASIIASSIIAAFVISMPDQLQKGVSRRFARSLTDSGRIEMWLIRVLAALAIVGGTESFFFGDPNGFWFGLWPNLITIGITVLGIDELNRRRSQRQYKQQIFRQMASASNDFALDATRIARDEDWLYDGSLMHAALSFANLQGVDLANANLRGVEFQWADLRGSLFIFADLGGADFKNAKLQGAVLAGADLRGVSFLDANLEGADLDVAELMDADLRGANLHIVNLRGGDLRGACYDSKTNWPDGFDPQAAGAILVDED